MSFNNPFKKNKAAFGLAAAAALGAAAIEQGVEHRTPTNPVVASSTETLNDSSNSLEKNVKGLHEATLALHNNDGEFQGAVYAGKVISGESTEYRHSRASAVDTHIETRDPFDPKLIQEMKANGLLDPEEPGISDQEFHKRLEAKLGFMKSHPEID